MPPTLIFDLGGVLVHLDWEKVCEPLTRLSDRGYDEVMEEIENGPVVESSMLGRLTPQEFHRTICEKLHVDMEYQHFIGIWSRLLSVDEVMTEYVAELAKSYTLVLASNTDGIHFPYCLEHFSVLKSFDRYFLSHEMGLLKPDPAYFHHVLYELWASPADCVFIDDRPDNVRAARNVGINGLVFESIDKLKADLSGLL